jgi:Outer membrane protein beta-barrel domain
MRMIHSLAIGMLTVLASSVALAQDPAAMPAAPAEPAAPAAAPAEPAAAPAAAPTEAAASGEANPVMPGVSAALLLGDGFKDGYNIGIGARVGYTLPMNLYIGAAFTYHLGKSQDNGLGGTAKTTAMIYGLEVGYALAVGPLAVRPYIGVGQVAWKFDTGDMTIPGLGTVAGTSGSDSYLTFWPGVTALYPLGNAFVGVDLKYNIVTGLPSGADSANAFGAFLTGGWSF